MDSLPGSKVVRIGEYRFDRSTGELRDLNGTARTRLAPQPAKLLELLIERNGELATREDIRTRLWPEIHVDFDPSLHFCVRQIRAAFGDSATEPSYVETLPRRGYRLARPVESIADAAETRPGAPIGRDDGGRSRRRFLRWAVLVAVAVAVAAVAVVTFQGRFSATSAASSPAGSTAQTFPARLAIMPFELASEGGQSATLARISEWLVADLAGSEGGGIDVVGPRSTAPYSEFPFPDLRRMAGELEVDYVLNARFLERDGERQLIVELIRFSDRSHPWVELYDDTGDWRAIARAVSAGVRGVLRPPS
jgi:DNA-binding winged helix-turn-helix (wHTH) protein/TolB-like protein